MWSGNLASKYFTSNFLLGEMKKSDQVIYKEPSTIIYYGSFPVLQGTSSSSMIHATPTVYVFCIRFPLLIVSSLILKTSSFL